MAEVASALYNSESLAVSKALQDVLKEFEQVNSRIGDKLAANIESFVASLLVLAFVKEAEVSKFNEAVFINKLDFLSTAGYLRDIYVRAAIRYLRDHTIVEDDEVSTLGLSIFLGLANSKEIRVEALKDLTTDGLMRIITEGVYVYYWWNVGKALPVKD